MSTSLFQVGLLSAGVIFLFVGGALAFVAARVASSGRAAKAEADIRLAASQELAAEVKHLAEKVGLSLQARDAALENAFLRHNDACAASVHSAFSGKGGHHDDDDDDHHKKHHSGGHHDDDDDDHHKKHHSAGGGHLFDDADDRGLSQGVAEKRPSLLARLLGRAA